MNKESHSLRSFQDFVRTVGIPPTLRRDNARTQTGAKWTGFERQMCVKGLMTEPHSPWQNASEHATNDLCAMTIRKMKECNIPLN